MRRTLVLPLAVLALLAACSDDGSGSSAPPATTAPAAGDASAAATASPGGDPTDGGVRLDVGDQLTERYCEVLTVTTTDDGVQAQVWGSQALNDCPQEGIDAIDPEAAAAQAGADLAIVNGPRFWTLDAIVANELAGSGEVQTFGGVEMRSIAIVELNPEASARTPYTETSVVRDTEFVFDPGTEVYELTGPDGSTYVMQSYTVEVDPALTAADLPGLGDRLQLPEGWAFSTRVLVEELAVEDLDGIATVIQDELHNTYQLRQRG